MASEHASRQNKIGTWAYRHIATAAGRSLARNEIVRSVLVRRSVSTGEVDFGRSDIDLTIVLSGPAVSSDEIELLLVLSRTYRWMRKLMPVIGECFALSPEELKRSYKLDSYRASIERRSALVVHGPPVEIPDIPVTTRGAVYRTVGWFRGYIPIALKHGNRRNLRKFAIEIWNAYATATGLITQPFLTRRETLDAWRQSEPELSLERLSRPELFRLCCRLAAKVHAALRPPLATLDQPRRMRARSTQYLVIPSPEYEVSRNELGWDTLLATPEILDLVLHYLNAFDYASLDSDIRDLGIEPPDYEDYVETGRRALDPFRLRTVGFLDSPSLITGTHRVLERSELVFPYLQRGETPPLEALRAFSESETVRDVPSDTAYYRHWYPDLYQRFREMWERYDALD